MKEILSSKMGIAGFGILIFLISLSIIALATIPIDTFQGWNNPENWLAYPKSAAPAWVNNFQIEKIPEHKMISSTISKQKHQDLQYTTDHYELYYTYDDFPNDIIYNIQTRHIGSPLVHITISRPDDITLDIISASLPYHDRYTIHQGKIFSTEKTIQKTLTLQQELFEFPIDGISSQDVIFSQTQENLVLKGKYTILVNIFSQQSMSVNSSLIIGGKAFGILGTDELRRDLAIGLLWGTPLALFIGVIVAIGSVSMGLLYGMYSGYKGRYTDETMMRLNDIVYALPALPFLIIISVTQSNSIFLMMGFLMIFGWVGIAKVSRSMTLQIKIKGYIEASKAMGQKNSKIIIKHILPQMLPYAFASIAISVPAAITTEAGLSFLGLGDPTFPTWGQMLHDANTHGAAARGLWWWIIPPGIMIALTGLAFVFIGNALDRIINPKMSQAR